MFACVRSYEKRMGALIPSFACLCTCSHGVDDDVPPEVMADSQRLRQILANFASNALKTGRNDGTGTVTLRASRASSLEGQEGRLCIELACIDNGPGISQADLETLFTPFQQLGRGQDAGLQTRGSGLGLVICKQIAELHGGRVGCHSELGRGSKFTAIIPFDPVPTRPDSQLPVVITPALSEPTDRARAVLAVADLSEHWCREPSVNALQASRCRAQAERSVFTGMTPPAGGGTLHILVVDDDKSNRLLLSRLLSRRLPAAVVSTANDGAEALAMATAQPFSVICLDCHMPVMNGCQAATAMRAAGVTALVIGCTGNTLDKDLNAFLAAGADVICVKPVNLAEIISHMQARGLV